MALLFALVESFLAGTSNHSFIWVYEWLAGDPSEVSRATARRAWRYAESL